MCVFQIHIYLYIWKDLEDEELKLPSEIGEMKLDES